MAIVQLGNVLGWTLTFDDDDIVGYNTIRESRITNTDAPPQTPVTRELGASSVVLTFRDGAHPKWEQINIPEQPDGL